MRLTIYRKFLIFVLPIVCISIFGVGYYSYLIAREEIVSEIGTTIQRQAGDMATEINRLCDRASIDLITLSELTTIEDYYNNVEFKLYHEAEICRRSIERFMLEFSRRSKVYYGISFIDGKGTEVSRVIKDQIGSRRKNLKDKVFFQEIKRLRRGDIYISPVENDDIHQGLILRHAIPIFNEIGEFKGGVTLDLDFEKIQNMVRGIKIGKTGYAYLINQGGLLLAHPESKRIFTPLGIPELETVVERMMAGRKGWGAYSTPGGDHLIGYAPVENLGWSVAVSAPFADFMGKINQIKVNSALTMLFIMSIATFGILVIATRISHPLKELVRSTQLISEGQFDHQLKLTSTDEIGDLAKSFNEMTAKLKSSQDQIHEWRNELEKRVMETTRELRAEKDKLEAVFKHMADGVIVIDGFSKVIDLNRAAETFIRAPKTILVGEQILGGVKNSKKHQLQPYRNLQIICEPTYKKEFVRCWDYFNCPKHYCPAHQSDEWRCWLIPHTSSCGDEDLEESPEAKMERCSRCRLFIQVREKYKNMKPANPREVTLDMPKRDLRIFKTPMLDKQNRFMGNVIVLQDITKDKELDQMKSDFISTVSHELRTPLSSIKSFSELLLDDLDTMDVEIQKRFLGVINEESERLTRLIADLLDLQKMDTEKMIFNREHIHLPQIIEKCLHSFSGLAKKKNTHLCYEPKGVLPLVYGDRDKLHQVLSNLLSNAIKFSGEKGGWIKVEAEEAPDGVLVSVSDQGIGIPEEKKEKVFEKFYQIVDSPVKEKTGAGLGLTITKEIVEHHGGRIWVESEVGEGSKFSFVIPKASVDGITASP